MRRYDSGQTSGGPTQSPPTAAWNFQNREAGESSAKQASASSIGGLRGVVQEGEVSAQRAADKAANERARRLALVAPPPRPERAPAQRVKGVVDSMTIVSCGMDCVRLRVCSGRFLKEVNEGVAHLVGAELVWPARPGRLGTPTTKPQSPIFANICAASSRPYSADPSGTPGIGDCGV